MRIEFLSTPVDVLTFDETVDVVAGAMRTRTPTRHVAINVAKIVKARSNAVLRDDIMSSDLVGIDGMGIILGLRLAGIRVPERVSGIDLMERLLQVCAERGFRPYFLGATPEVVAEAARVACARFPGLRFAGIHDGYFRPDQEAGVVEEIRLSGADCLFVGLPTPRKERFMASSGPSMPVPFMMGVGGAFDVLAGKVQRAPFWMQRVGLEWLYRILQEPGRLWWRYLSTNLEYAGLLILMLLRRAAGSHSG